MSRKSAVFWPWVVDGFPFIHIGAPALTHNGVIFAGPAKSVHFDGKCQALVGIWVQPAGYVVVEFRALGADILDGVEMRNAGGLCSDVK